MPAAYAHLTFGRSVLHAVTDPALTRYIQPHQELFEIGLQGPDILFFYRPLKSDPVNRLGHGMHDKHFLPFLDRPICRCADDRGTAYLLGLICHYALDRECHTPVEYFMSLTGRLHSEVETDLERCLMSRDGLDVRRHAPSSYLADTQSNADVIAPFYGLTGGVVKSALTSMKRVSRLLTPVNSVKHAILTFVTGRMGAHSLPRQLVMDLNPDPVYGTSNRVLSQAIENAVPVALTLMEDFLRWKEGRGPLSDRFNRTFSYDPQELQRLKEERAYV